MGRIYTDSESAKQFVEETGVDDLAVAIGTVHGPYPSGENDIRIDILKKLNATLKMPLVLHGAYQKLIFRQILKCHFIMGLLKLWLRIRMSMSRGL